jgi:hypothetical protein
VDFASFTNFREAGNEPSGFIEVEEFFWLAGQVSASREVVLLTKKML